MNYAFQHLRYRKTLNMDSPAYRNFQANSVMAMYFTRGELGYDKHGRPVVYFPFGGIDPKGMSRHGPRGF